MLRRSDIATPFGFRIVGSCQNERRLMDWPAAVVAVDAELQASTERRHNGTSRDRLDRSTLAFIRDGAENEGRHRLLFAAAADLAGFGCSLQLVLALRSEAALDSGLPPSEVRRQIECGLKHGR